MAIVAMPEQIKAVNYSLVDIFTQATREKKWCFYARASQRRHL